MQSYLKSKKHYDRKAKAAPLRENFLLILQPKADSQGSKIPLRDYKWIGFFVIQNVLPNDKYIVRSLNNNKTKSSKSSQQISSKKFVANAPLEDEYRGEKQQPDDEIVKLQDDLYTISWKVDLHYELFEPRTDNWPDAATRLPNEAASGKVDYYVTKENENSSANDCERCSEKRNEKESSENGIRQRPSSS